MLRLLVLIFLYLQAASLSGQTSGITTGCHAVDLNYSNLSTVPAT